jgi:hypothetical protein
LHETLRIDMPTQMLGARSRATSRCTATKLRAGSGLLFLWGSANRDEREFQRPRRYDLRRRAPRILSFGHGQHMCLGKPRRAARRPDPARRSPARDARLRDRHRGHPALRSEFFRGFGAMPIRVPPF